MPCRRDEIVSSNWCFKRCCSKVLILAAKPPGVDALKRYRKSRHPCKMKWKGLSELKKLKSRLFRQFMRFSTCWKFEAVLLYLKEVDLEVWTHWTQTDGIRLHVITWHSGAQAHDHNWISSGDLHLERDSKYTHREHTIRSQVTNGISIAVVGSKIKVVKVKYQNPRIHWAHVKSLWWSSHYSFDIVQGDSDSQYSNHAVGFN